ncbi:MAG: iron export ABC transporter permease subunit FetB [Planctomycetales bacterium]|nr:iron export ABC transporter permease subunit FetB [Planctomycetales bacterium]
MTHELSLWQLSLAAILLVVNVAISAALRLGLERRLIWAAARAVAQLSLIGLVLNQVFAVRSPVWVLAVMSAMTLAAASACIARAEHRYRGMWLHALVSVSVSAWLVNTIAILWIVEATPWYEPRYAIPLLGMILGNALNGIAIGVERFTTQLRQRSDEVEARLAAGATRWEAAIPMLREASRAGMIPIINTLSVTGIVSLPGMMTGQLLAGADPGQAVRYQLMILFLIAAASALGTILSVVLVWSRLFNARHIFLRQQLRSTPTQPTMKRRS